MAIQSKNPSTEEILKTFTEITEVELEEKVSLASNAFSSWKKTSFEERANLMRKLGEYLRTHTEEFSKLQMLEMGKTMKSGPSGIEKCAFLCDYYADNTEKILQTTDFKLITHKLSQFVNILDKLRVLSLEK